MKRFSIIYLFLAALMALSACVREIDQIGLNLQDGNMLLGNNYNDSTTIIAYSTRNDSLVTSKVANCIVGCVNDPVFGRTVAGFYTQFELKSGSVDFTAGATIDSVRLSLRYSGFFGDTLSPITLEVYEVQDDMKDSLYYNYSTSPADVINLTYQRSYTLRPKPTTYIAVDTGYVPSYFSIRLADELGQRFLDKRTFSNIEDVRNCLKGLYVTARSSSSTGNLVYVALTAALSGLEIHYTENGGAHKSYTFPIAKNCMYYSHFDHNDYNNASMDFKSQVLNGHKELGDKVLYAQATAGVKTVIKMPYLQQSLKNIANKKVVINKAELVITNISNDPDYYNTPYNLSLQAIGNDGSLLKLPDDASLTSSAYFGGIYNEKKKEYRFRITRYVQQVMNGVLPNNGINLVVSGASVRANRLIFCGPKPDEFDYDKRLRLEISYTTY